MENNIKLKWQSKEEEEKVFGEIFPTKYCFECIFSNIQNDMQNYKIICKKAKQEIKGSLKKSEIKIVEIPKWCCFKN